MTRGIVFGILCGLLVAMTALIGLSVLLGPHDAIANGPTLFPDVTSDLTYSRSMPATDVISVSPLRPLKDASKSAGPELMVRAPTSPQRRYARLEVVGVYVTQFAPAPRQTLPQQVSPVPRDKAVLIGNARMAPMYRKIEAVPVFTLTDLAYSRSLTSLVTDINRKRKNSEAGAYKNQPSPESVLGKQPALVRFSEQVEISPTKPKMSIILLDDGSHSLDLDILAAFPYPITFALDANWKGAVAAMKSYRSRGFEVMVLAEFADEVAPDDAQKTLQNYLRKLPQAVGVVEARQGGLQARRAVSDGITRLLQATGHGMVLFPTPLNAARTLAQKSGVPAATLFRDFDSKDQNAQLIRNFLDQATLKARSDGSVIMIGRLRSETIKALVLWGLQDRVNHVAMAPISSILQSTRVK